MRYNRKKEEQKTSTEEAANRVVANVLVLGMKRRTGMSIIRPTSLGL